jgi:hypothetical protein
MVGSRVRSLIRRDTACKAAKLGGDSMRYSTHSRRSANASMKTLDALRLQPLTSEPYCLHAAEEEVALGSVALLVGAAPFGALAIRLPERKKGRSPLREVQGPGPNRWEETEGNLTAAAPHQM